MENSQKINLFGDFKTVPHSEYVQKAIQELKGKDFESLVRDSYEGIQINPIYDQSSIKPLNQAVFLKKPGWRNREEVPLDSLEKSISLAHEALQKGADSLQFIFSSSTPPTFSLKSLWDALPKGDYEKGFSFLTFHQEWLKELEKLSFNGCLQYDFLSEWTISGAFPENGFEQVYALAQLSSSQKGFSFPSINTRNYHNAGANAVQELALAISSLVQYVDELSNRGLSYEDCLKNVEISMAIGSHYFMEIAKFRAIRGLFALLLKSYGLGTSFLESLKIHASTSLWNKSAKDINVNMIRNTTEAMAALIGNCDAITVNPYNTILGKTDEFSRRIARNVPLMLKEESHLDKVIDIASGTYYVEYLTAELISKSWALFLKMEEQGGFVKAFEKGFIQAEINRVAARKKENFQNGKDIMVGTNKYENKQEVAAKASKTKEAVSSHQYPLLKQSRLSEMME